MLNNKAAPLAKLVKTRAIEYVDVLTVNAAAIGELFPKLFFAKLCNEFWCGRNSNQKQSAGF